MQTRIYALRPLLIAAIVLAGSCDPIPMEPEPCRIVTFLWEGQLYDCVYSPSGRLTQLVSPASHVDLLYDETDKLIQADHYLPGDASPSYQFYYSHGTSGITEIDLYHGGEHSKRTFHYTTSGEVDHIVYEEYYMGSVSLTITQDLTFVDENLMSVSSTSSVINTLYTIDQYDNDKNPFIVLAAALGNPKFFPLGTFASFPVGNFDVSFGNHFSKNNPHYGRYEIVGSGLDPEIQEFIYSYSGRYPTDLTWNNTSYGTTISENYGFTHSCP